MNEHENGQTTEIPEVETRRRCAAFTQHGEPCRLFPLKGLDHCLIHDQSERGQALRDGGRALGVAASRRDDRGRKRLAAYVEKGGFRTMGNITEYVTLATKLWHRGLLNDGELRLALQAADAARKNRTVDLEQEIADLRDELEGLRRVR